MSNLNFIHGSTIHLEDNSVLDFIEVKSEKERHDYAEQVHNCTSNAQSVNYHIPVNIEDNVHIDGNLVVSGSLTSSTPAIDNNRIVLNTDLNSIADSTLLPIKDPGTSPMAGWYVNNAGGDKANYYFYGKTSPEVHTLDELKYIYALCDVRSGGNLFLSVYTERQFDGNDAGSWYRSRKNYIIEGTRSTATTGLALLKANLGEEPSDIFDSVQRVDCTLDEFSSNGPQAGSENILTISVQTDSGAGAGTIEYVIQNVGFKLEHVIQNFMLTTDNFSSEADIRTIVESYGYQDEAMVNALIATALVPYETSAEIDARGYKTQPEIEAIVESYNYQTEPDVNNLISTALTDYETSAEIDARNYLDEPSIQALIDASATNTYLFEGVLASDTSVNGQDNAWYLSGANNLSATAGGAYWDGNVYTTQEAGDHEVKMHVTAQVDTDEFKCYVEQLSSDLSTVEKKYILDWSRNAYGRNSSLTIPAVALGKKIRFGVFNPQAIGQFILGQALSDRVYENFESLTLNPISDSSSMSIQAGWSGGSQTYFQNDSTDDETIVNTLSVAPGSQSWFTGNVALYGNPGTGSPHTPRLAIESGAVDENAFNLALRGKTYNASFYFYSPSANNGDNSTLKVYNGTYQGNDRSGFNLNIKKANAALTVTSFSYDPIGNAFNEETLETNLAYDQWHFVQISITYDAGGDPNNDQFTYEFNSSGTVHTTLSWPNVWRVAPSQGFAPVYGTRIAFGESNHVSGWYIDNIDYSIAGESEINTHVSVTKAN